MGTVLKGMEGVVRGYRPQVDWGGEEGSPTIVMGGHNVKLGTSGWRKRCLFLLLGFLLLIAVINLVMTFYLLKTIHFHTQGAGDLYIEVGGVKTDGISRLDHSVTVSNIRGKPDEDLEILGYYNLTTATVTPEGHYGSAVVLDSSSGLVAWTKGIQLRNEKGKLLFEAKANGTRVGEGAKFLTITGQGGADFDTSIQTPRILGDEVHEFRVESKTRSVIGRAGDLLRIESRAGDVTATSLHDASLVAKNGKFRFESPNVFFPNLVTEGEPIMRQEPLVPSATTQVPRSSEYQIPAPAVPLPTLAVPLPAPAVPLPTPEAGFVSDETPPIEGGQKTPDDNSVSVYQVDTDVERWIEIVELNDDLSIESFGANEIFEAKQVNYCWIKD